MFLHIHFIDKNKIIIVYYIDALNLATKGVPDEMSKQVGGYPVFVRSLDDPGSKGIMRQMEIILYQTVVMQRQRFYYDTRKWWTFVGEKYETGKDIGNKIKRLLGGRLPVNIERPDGMYQLRGSMGARSQYIYPQVLCLYIDPHTGNMYLYPLYAPGVTDDGQREFDKDTFIAQIKACLDRGNNEPEYLISAGYKDEVLPLELIWTKYDGLASQIADVQELHQIVLDELTGIHQNLQQKVRRDWTFQDEVYNAAYLRFMHNVRHQE